MFGFVMLGQVTLAAMDEMFEAARAIMHWFGECAKVCSHFIQRLLYFTFLLFNIFFSKKKTFCKQIIASENETVRWTTPLGLPVVQPYLQMGTKLVSLPEMNTEDHIVRAALLLSLNVMDVFFLKSK